MICKLVNYTFQMSSFRFLSLYFTLIKSNTKRQFLYFCFNQTLLCFFFRLWGSPPPFSKDSFFDDYSTPSVLEYDVAAEVEWSVIKYFAQFSDEAQGFFSKQTRLVARFQPMGISEQFECDDDCH